MQSKTSDINRYQSLFFMATLTSVVRYKSMSSLALKAAFGRSVISLGFRCINMGTSKGSSCKMGQAMSTDAKSSSGAIHIHETDDRKVVLTPTDEDRFVLTCAETVRVAQRGLGERALIDEFASMFRFIVDWCQVHSDLVNTCYAGPRDGQIVFFVVGSSEEFDFGLADELADLDLQLSKQYSLIDCEIHQIPNSESELKRFVGHGCMRQIYGTFSSSQEEVAPQS